MCDDWEPFHTTNDWEVKFNFPKDLTIDSTNQVKFADGVFKLDRIESDKVSTKRLCKKIQNDINNLHIEFNCNTDTDAVRNWMNLWLEQACKEDENRLLKYFVFRQDEKHPNALAMVLKTPLNKLTNEEKQEIKDLLIKITDIDVEQLNDVLK